MTEKMLTGGKASTQKKIFSCFSLESLFPGTLSVEAIYQDRDQFAQLVREVASPDVGKMGIEILSFTIKDIFDNVEYLASLGRAQTANVKRDADIGVAEAHRDAGIRVSDLFGQPPRQWYIFRAFSSNFGERPLAKIGKNNRLNFKIGRN